MLCHIAAIPAANTLATHLLLLLLLVLYQLSKSGRRQHVQLRDVLAAAAVFELACTAGTNSIGALCYSAGVLPLTACRSATAALCSAGTEIQQLCSPSVARSFQQRWVLPIPASPRPQHLDPCSAAAASYMLTVLCSPHVSLQELLALPASLLTLDCQNCKALRHLPDLRHTAMSYMDCSGCELLQELPDLPRTLASLYVEHIRGLTQLPLLPNLRCMSRLSACGSGIRQLSVLPPYLHELDCSRTAIQQLPRKLPATLDRLSVSHCGQLRALPEELPAGLDELDCEHCQQLQALPAALPEQLRWLSIKGCTAIERLPVLPGSLEYLDVEECAALKQVRLQNADGATLTVRLHR